MAVNLFNLLPIYPLDGGRLTRSLIAGAGSNLTIAYLGATIVLLAAGIYYFHLWSFGLFIMVCVVDIIGQIRRTSEEPERPLLAGNDFSRAVLWYVGLAASFFLGIMLFEHVPGVDLVARALRS